jgi:cytoskeletal protein RodZ
MASFGENLKRERELRGIELRDIADATNISIRFLQALEQDRVEVLPGGIFRRAFVRQYARHLGLDPERTVADFLYAHGERGDDAESAPPAPRRPAAPRGLLLSLLLLAAGVLVLVKGVSRPPERPSEAAAPRATAPVPAVPTLPPEEPPAVSASVEREGLVLTLQASQPCWVAVEADGSAVLNRVLGQGETETIEAAGEIILSVGNAGGVSFVVNDRPGVPLGKSGEVRRNIVISRKNLPSLVQEAAPPDPGTHSS